MSFNPSKREFCAPYVMAKLNTNKRGNTSLSIDIISTDHAADEIIAFNVCPFSSGEIFF